MRSDGYNDKGDEKYDENNDHPIKGASSKNHIQHRSVGGKKAIIAICF